MGIRDRIYDIFMARREMRAEGLPEAALPVGAHLRSEIERRENEALIGWAARNAERSLAHQGRFPNGTIAEALDPSPPGRRGHFMRLASGAKFWPIDPRPEEVFIDDIAKSLSKQCRFNGHTEGNGFYSVAEHSVWCSHYVPPEHALEALLHDAAEAYVGDVIRPIKVLPEVAAVFGPIEDAVERAIARRFGLRFPFHPEVKRADEAVCTRELRTIMNGVRANAEDEQALVCTIEEAPYALQCLPPYEAERAFLQRFFELMGERNRLRWIGASVNPPVPPHTFLSPMALGVAA